jgi:hypothetical protein
MQCARIDGARRHQQTNGDADGSRLSRSSLFPVVVRAHEAARLFVAPLHEFAHAVRETPPFGSS